MQTDKPLTDARDPREGWQGIRMLLLALIVAGTLGLISLVMNVVNIESYVLAAGRVTKIVHYTPVTGLIMVAVVIFHFWLAWGIFMRRHIAWRMAFILPGLWISLFLFRGWLLDSGVGGSYTIPICGMTAIAIWQMVEWRKRWMTCRDLFH